ncbi:MAG: aminopeptidase [Gammaproteobacteria bacterium]|nr:aminopeptidase [Gammaproteobacteria bacterium]
MSRSRYLLPCLFAMLSACSQIGYYTQAVQGHWEIIAKREKISALVGSDDTPEDLKRKLTRVQDIREFASRVLALPDNRSFTYFTDTGRPYVLWNVVAAPAYHLSPKTWCFPVAGCVAYKGFFSEKDADEFNAGLVEQGLDTFQYGVSAYSTLGWFSDSVLNTHLHYPETSLAGLIFHELAHQVAYAKGDSDFNEAFATAVEVAGLEHWFSRHGTAEQYEAFLEDRKRNERITAMVLGFRARLAQRYENEPESALPHSKRALFSEMKSVYEEMKNRGEGTPYYDWWFTLDLNNAHLALLSTYHRHVPALQTALDRSGSFQEFYALIREKSRLPKSERDQWLSSLEPH